MLRKWYLACVVLPLLALLVEYGRRRRLEHQKHQEHQRLMEMLELMEQDLGKAHPLWQVPSLCPSARRSGGEPVRYPALNFCPVPMFELMRLKLHSSGHDLEYNGDKREAWNAEAQDVARVIGEYWVLDAAAMVAIIGANATLTMWLLNIGASPSGVAANAARLPGPGDDVSPLFPMGYSGLCVDLPENAEKMKMFYRRWPKAHQEVQATTPALLLERLRALQVPKNLDIIKIDIDSFECDFLEALFKDGFRPKIVTMELCSSFPPPLKFKTKMEGYPIKPTRFTPLQGCSLQYAFDFLRSHGYTLIQYVIEDGWFVQDEYAPLFGRLHTDSVDLYELGNPFQFSKWPWPEFHWSLWRLRREPEKMLALARKGAEALALLRPGLEQAQYVLEVSEPRPADQ